jgi:ABC-type glycerol-3-phosphate transport system permease component
MVKRISLFDFLKWLILLTGAVIMLFPFLWMVITSIKIPQEVMSYPPILIPNKITFERYRRILVELNFIRYFFNSIYISAIVTTAVLFTSSILGYVFAKFEFKGKNILFIAVLSTMMIPFPVLMIPLYLLLGDVGLVDTHLAIILPSLFNTFGVFLMRQFMQNIPTEFLEAGRIDGASEFKIFFKLILPQTKPALAALAIFSFMWQWDSYLWPLISLSTDKNFTLPLGLAMFSNQYWTDIGLVMAGATVSVIPVIIVFLFMQNKFVEGITMTGLKG